MTLRRLIAYTPPQSTMQIMKVDSGKTYTNPRYDDCIGVPAEQNALMTAARVRIPLEGGSVYSVYQPCFGRIK
jgi:deoxycytidylate deaminase